MTVHFVFSEMDSANIKLLIIKYYLINLYSHIEYYGQLTLQDVDSEVAQYLKRLARKDPTTKVI